MVGMVPVLSACPRCGTSARVRSVPAEYAAGVSVTETQTRFIANGGRYRGHSRSRSVQRTVLARDLAPPPTLPSAVGATIAAVVIGGLAGLLVVAATLPGNSDEGAWFLSAVASALAVLCALVAVRRRRRIQREGALTTVAWQLWQQALYCNGCGSAFLPAGRAVPAPKLRAALRNTATNRLATSTA